MNTLWPSLALNGYGYSGTQGFAPLLTRPKPPTQLHKKKGKFMEHLDSLENLLVHELRDLYHAEKQIVKALPNVMEAAHSPELKRALEQHFHETEGHVERLEQVFQSLGQPAKAVKCKAMAGILDEGEDLMDLKGTPETIDAGIIASAQKVEHYEMAGYGSAATWAAMLGRTDIKQLLGQTLQEEQQADRKLTELATAGINQSSAVQQKAA